MWFTSSQFRELVSGRRQDWRAAAWRTALSVAEGPYTRAVTWRNRRFDLGRRTVHTVPVPVISVGNITLGGVGKSPVVAWLARWFRQRQVRVGIVSRGYGAKPGAPNDEALELAHKLPHVPHVQNADRVAGAKLALEEHACQALVLDDAFQHRRLHRDVDIVVLDALEPFGYDRVFPRGLLREPLTGLRRAHLVALARADQVDLAAREAIRRRVAEFAPAAAWIEMRHRPQRLASADGRQAELDLLQGAAVAAFCGIGNPIAFRRTLECCGCRVAAFEEFPDHHIYTREDLARLEDRFVSASDATMVVCTQKDLVKLRTAALGALPLWAVTIDIEVTSGGDKLEALLAPCLKQVTERACPREEKPRSGGPPPIAPG